MSAVELKLQIGCRRLEANLRKAGDPLALAIAERLASCSADRPCGSGACPRCGRQLQQAAVRLQECAIRTPARASLRGRTSTITLIPPTGRALPGEFGVEQLCAVREATRQALLQADLPRAIVGSDVSYNEDLTGQVEEHWQVHAHGLVPDWLTKQHEDKLRGAIGGGARSVHVQWLDEREAGAAYPFKPDRFRRVSYLNRSHPSRQPYRDTHSRELRPWQRVELAKVEHEFGLARRLLIHGVANDLVERAFAGAEWLADGL